MASSNAVMSGKEATRKYADVDRKEDLPTSRKSAPLCQNTAPVSSPYFLKIISCLDMYI